MSRFGIKSLEIENFKGIGSKPVKINFKPITLLFGPNSSGKSTILQALNYLEDILNNINPDAERLTKGGETNLGGFQNFIHKKDLKRTLKIKLELNLDDDGIPSYDNRNFEDEDEIEESSEDFSVDWNINRNNPESCFIQVEIDWNSVEHSAKVTFFSVGINGLEIAKLDTSQDSRQESVCRLVDFNINHPLILDLKDELEDFGHWEDSNFVDLHLYSHKNSIPTLGKELFSEETLEDQGINESFSLLATQCILGPLELSLQYLKGKRYIGPIRKTPPRGFKPPPAELPYRWATGLAAWDQLINESENLFKDSKGSNKLPSIVSSWLSGDRLKTGYNLTVENFYIVDELFRTEIQLLISKMEDLDGSDLIPFAHRLEEQKKSKVIKLIDERHNTPVELQDIGIGISQVIPVIVGAITKFNLLAIEQPELHLHPAIQCNLADLFISRKNLNESKQFLLETHSEHLLLRLLRRIREKFKNKTPEENLLFTNNELAVYFIEIYKNETLMREIPINEAGEMAEEWPNGFFDEDLEELFDA